jgi:hypothetical protein
LHLLKEELGERMSQAVSSCFQWLPWAKL